MNLGLDREETAADRSNQSLNQSMPMVTLGRGRTLFSSEETDSC